MATTAVLPERKNYINAEHGIRSWLFTTDHKRIALLYLLSITAFFFIGGFFALLVRLELLTPAGDLLLPDTYNKAFTMHGQVMVFFFLIPSIPAVLGNFLIPIMIGAKDLAFPRINLLSWYIYIAAGLLYLHCIFTGGVDTGWTFYTPYSSLFSNSRVIEAGLAIFISGFSSILTGLELRGYGASHARAGHDLVTVAAVRLGALRHQHHHAAGDAGHRHHPGAGCSRKGAESGHLRSASRGGDPVLFQHLFWFYSHPAVYIMILPSMGIVSEIVTCFSRKRVFGYNFVAMSSIAIAVIGFLVWAHHMFVAGISLVLPRWCFHS